MQPKTFIRLTALFFFTLIPSTFTVAQSRLEHGEKLNAGSVLTNKNGVLMMRFCGNLVFYDKNHTVIWESATYVDYSQRVRYLQMSEKGDLEVVITADNVHHPLPLWSSGTSEKYGAEAAGAHLEIDWDHHLLKIINKAGKVLWCNQNAKCS